MGDLETAIAFVARRAGKPAMPPTEWAHYLSLGLGWMTPGQARAFVERARAAGVLAPGTGDGGEWLRVAPAVAALAAPPLGFRPDPAAAAEPQRDQDPFAQWLDRVAVHLKVTRPQVLEQVAARQERMSGLLTAWAALLWLAAESGLDVRDASRIKA